MKCPVDDTVLVMSDRQGIEIDYCPQCRGVWLDRGELDKIIDRSAGPSQSDASHYKQDSRDSHRETDSRSAHYDSDDYHHKKKHKKEGFLGDLIDF